MCFHISNTKKATKVEDAFNARFEDINNYEPYYHFNGWETKSLYIIKSDETHLIEPAFWGILPDDYSIKARSPFLKKTNTLNARNDNVLHSRLYSQFIEDQRCLIIADGFFEPHQYNGVSYPFYITPKNDAFFAFAGVYSETLEGDFTASIITCEATKSMSEIHNKKSKRGDFRMPLVLENYNEWLEGDYNHILKSKTDFEFNTYPVSKDLFSNKVNSNVESILNKVEFKQNDLFS